MWLDNSKYKNELSAVCAGNGIRIVEDEFETSEALSVYLIILI